MVQLNGHFTEGFWLDPLHHSISSIKTLCNSSIPRTKIKSEVEEEEEIIMSTVTTTTTTNVLLPQEIIMEILSRLPASSLVSSFKLVCKSWLNLIKDPDFVKMHHLHHLNRGGGEGGAASITANSSLIYKSGKDLFQLHPPFNFKEGGLLPPIASAPTKKLDFDSLSLNSRLVGSCNGLLLCLSLKADENIILLNPSTRKYKISPKQPIKYHPTTRMATYGFGCCCSTTNNICDDDEYKVVRIVYYYGIGQGGYSSRSQFDIYSMSSNSWRRMDTRDYAFSISSKQSGVFVNEALHWVAASFGARWDTIASFDIRDEEFRQVPTPLPSCEPYDESSYFNLTQVILMNMKGCLSMIRFSHANNNSRMDDDTTTDLEIWVMKEYGIQKSWTKEFVISSGWDTDPPRALSEFKISWRPNAYVLKGDQILIEGLTDTKEGCRLSWEGVRKLVLYDINKRKINGDFKMIGVPDEPNEPYPRIDLVDYIETLVSLKSSIMPGVLL